MPIAMNPNTPNGFRPVGTLSGSPWQDSVRAFTLDAGHSAMYVGDLVKMTTDGYLDTFAASNINLMGAVVGVQVNRGLNAATEHPGYMPANIAGVVYVATAPDIIWEAQEDGDTTPLVLADVGQNVEIIDSGGSTTTGLSGMQIDSSTKNTTNTLPFRLIGLIDRSNNQLASVDSTKANARWNVVAINHTYRTILGL